MQDHAKQMTRTGGTMQHTHAKGCVLVMAMFASLCSAPKCM